MRLNDLTRAVPGAHLAPRGATADTVDVAALRYRSGDVTAGDAFACLVGSRTDGHEYAADAVARGASALVVQRALDLDVPQIVVPDSRMAMALMGAVLEGSPSQHMTVVGITGTNGKTTDIPGNATRAASAPVRGASAPGRCSISGSSTAGGGAACGIRMRYGVRQNGNHGGRGSPTISGNSATP
jgi:hypothetical protein